MRIAQRWLVIVTAALVPSTVWAQATAAPAPSTVPAPARFEQDIQKFEAADRTTPPPKNGILFVGSSSIRLWTTLQEDFPGLPVINRGFGGSLVSDVLAFTDRIVFPYEPRLIVFFCGTNDIWAGRSADAVIADTKTFIESVHRRLPRTKIGYVSIAPAPSRWESRQQSVAVNEAVQALAARDPLVTYIDLWSAELDPQGQPRPELFQADRLHPNADGYAIWKRLVGAFIQKNWTPSAQ